MKLNWRGLIVVGLLFVLLLIGACFVTVGIMERIAPVKSDKVQINCVPGAVKQADGTCIYKE